MKDRKSLYLLIFSLIVVTISFVLISIWGYHFYFVKNETTAVAPKAEQPPLIVHKTSIKDSLESLLNSAINEPGNQNLNDSLSLDSSVDTTLAVKLIEFNRLKNEIAELLKNRSSSKDTAAENAKILQLQQSVEALKEQNDEVAAENARLNTIVKQLIDKKANSPKLNSSNREHLASSAYNLPVLVSHLRFLGLSVSNDRKVTNIAAKTERLYGSFQVNVKPTNRNTEIYVVIIQPDGKTLVNSQLKSGTFETKTGSKVYSALLHFDNVRDNGNRLVFSIDSPNFQKGKYAMQIYHQGIMIGRLTRTLF